jgi:16S rRNA (cytidine1402-2'-O)-methyltransferase
VLKEANLIAAEDTRRTAKLLSHFGIATRTVSLHEHNERARTRVLLEHLARGETVALVSDAGMPLVSDPGATAVREALKVGARVEVVPGASALITAMAGAGFPTDTTSFVGFAPARAGERRRWLQNLRAFPGTLVFFEAPHRLRQSLEDLQQILGDREVAVAHELTKVHESWHRGPVSRVLAEPELPDRGEFTVVVGPDSDLGVHTTPVVPDTAQIGHEFGRLTKSGQRNRKEAIAELALRYNLPKRQVYALVEASKDSGE